MQLSTDPSQPAAPGATKAPRHVAIIMDGNGRWAKKRGLPRLAGHREGVGRIQKVLETLDARGVQHVTLFAFSTENWNRPPGEVQGIMDLLSLALKQQTCQLHEKNVRVIHLGSVDQLSPALRQGVAEAQKLTCDNTGVTLNVAFNYGGRDEILEAVRRIIRDQIPPEAVDQRLFSSYLYSAHSPDPDLIIRTGGELRISNFLLWQSAYSEYYHTPTLWPDLEAAELEQALETFASRQRRFGNVTSEA
ncbi:MAG: di-trans,poly-cis-decaprenylcistransferase [Dehalococcoidia bacterium]|nr:di-trans,poly-cis-decaprenylcistransferase [Dehalococcoidia bacterium]MSQ16706.1 di-trans,poly-cis-decaprenylcistransferase [Dehalococcoidia bacterium]